jgi:hypothetical protein
MAVAQKLADDATRNRHWSGYVSRAGLQQMQEANKQAGSTAGAMLSALESGQTDDPSTAYEQLQNVLPPEQFSQFRWNTNDDGSVVDGPLTRTTLGMIRTGNVTAAKQGDLANAYKRANSLVDWREAQAEAARARAQAITAKNQLYAVGSTGADSATGGVVSAAPGGPGSLNMMDPNTGQKYILNKSGAAFQANDDGTFTAISPNAVPKNAVKVGNIGAAGARENVFNARVILAGNQASKDLNNVVQLPVTVSTGVFGGRKQGPGLLDATKEVLTNTVTGQDAQIYQAAATGFQRNLAAIESAGLMPSGALTDQMNSVIIKEGDTNLTKLTKLAQIRQIVDSGMEVVIANPRVSDSEKDVARKIMGSVEKSVPYTVEDIIHLANSPKTMTLRDLLKQKEQTTQTAAPAAAPANATETKYLGSEPVYKVNGVWTKSSGEVWKDGKWQKP